jgi:serine/threonine-protein kinase
MIGHTLGHYRIVAKVGAGGMGEVYSARDERLERDVALKVLPAGVLSDEPARKRFRQEALALSKLNHPAIATIYDFDADSGVDFLVMELVIGETLAQKLAIGPLPEKEIVRLGGQITGALEEAHEQGIIHRDLKPSNIMVTAKGRVKVLDFGLAKLLRATPNMTTADTLNQTKGVAGTLPYMAPEQLQGEPVDARSDIFSCGTVLYELATGQRPFREAILSRLTDAILHQPPVSPRALNPRISLELERAIMKCLEKDPEFRYQSARELGVDLHRLASPTVATVAAPAQRSRVLPLRAVLVSGAGLVILVALAVFNPGSWRDRVFGHAGVPNIESLAVLPLENFSGDPQQQYFADGMTDALITDLSKISALRVISRTSVMQYKGVKKPLPQIARELNVDAVLEGSIQRSGDRVRITAQLIYGPADRHLWADSYERDLRDVLAMEGEVAKAIASEIRVALTPQEQARLGRVASINPQAHDAYLRGLYSFNRGRDTDGTQQGNEFLQRSIEQFQEAIRIDPNYAQAYAGMARAYHWLAGGRYRELYPKSQEAARKALELDDDLAEAHGALGYVALVYDWNFPEAEKRLQQAISLNPNYDEAHHGYGLYLSAVGSFDKAVAEFQRARELDPFTIPLRENAASTYACARRNDLATQEAKGLLLVDPNNITAHNVLGTVYVSEGRTADAIVEFKSIAQLSGNNPAFLVNVAWANVLSGKRDEASKIRSRLMTLPYPQSRSSLDIAAVSAILGDKEQAFMWLDKAFQKREFGIPYLKCNPEFDSLHSDPRFQDLLRSIGLPP